MGDGKDYICDDIGVVEHVEMIRNMTDEEFEKYIAEMKKETKSELIPPAD